MNKAPLVSRKPRTYSIGVQSGPNKPTNGVGSDQVLCVEHYLVTCMYTSCECTVVAIGFDRIATWPVKPEDRAGTGYWTVRVPSALPPKSS